MRRWSSGEIATVDGYDEAVEVIRTKGEGCSVFGQMRRVKMRND